MMNASKSLSKKLNRIIPLLPTVSAPSFTWKKCTRSTSTL